MPDKYGGHSATFVIDDETIELRYGDELPDGLPDSVIATLRDQGALLDQEPDEVEAFAPGQVVLSDHAALIGLSDEQFAAVVEDATGDELIAAVKDHEDLTARLLAAEQQRSKPRKGILALEK